MQARSVHGCTQTATHAGFPYALSLRPITHWAALEGWMAVALMAEHDVARKARPMTTTEQAVCTGVRNLRAFTRFSLRPIPQWAPTAVALMADHDDARQASSSVRAPVAR